MSKPESPVAQIHAAVIFRNEKTSAKKVPLQVSKSIRRPTED
jgi:hypothetical protein